MKLILSLSLFIFSNLVSAGDIDPNIMLESGAGGVSATGQALIQQKALVSQAKKALKDCGVDPDECGPGNSKKWCIEGCLGGEKKADKDGNITCKDTTTDCSEYQCTKKEIKSSCTALDQANSSGATWGVVASQLISIAAKIGGGYLGQTCEQACPTNQITGPDLTRCLCKAIGRDKKPCKNPDSDECLAVKDKSCAEQTVGLENLTQEERQSIIDACDCGKRNTYDPRGGWHLNDKNVCVNSNDENENNNNNDNSTPDPDLQYNASTPNSSANSSNGNASGAAAKVAGAGSTSGAGAGGSLGAGGAGGAKNNNSKKDAKMDPSALTGHGSGRSSNLAAGGSGGGMFSTDGSPGAAAKKKVKEVKDIAKSDGETIFTLVTGVYKSMVDANALDTMMTKATNKKSDKKAPAATKKQKVKKG